MRTSRYAALALFAAAIGAGLTFVLSRPSGTGPVTLEAGPMRFVARRPPGSHASRPGPANLVFVSPRIGFAATTGGVHDVPREGWAPATDRGRIERTDDGGASWRTLWSARRVAFDSLAVSWPTIVAGGYVTRRVGGNVPDPVGKRFVLASGDGGRTWQRRPAPQGGGAIQLLTPTIWVAFRPRDEYAFPVRSAGGFRSEDAGRHWRRLPLPQGPEVLRFVTAAVGFAGARGEPCPRASQLWRTSDGGATWSSVPRTCGRPYADLAVVSKKVLFAAQADEESNHPSSVLRRSDDGGRSWQTVWRERGRQIERLAFADARLGFVVSNEPHYDWRVVYISLRATADGGRTWSARSLPYVWSSEGTPSGGGPEVPGFFLDARHQWAGDDGAGIVWRTSDGARTWRLSAESLNGEKQSILAEDGSVIVQTAAGPARSRDGGRTWVPSSAPSDGAIAVAERRGAYLVVGRFRGPGSNAAVMATPDGGKTWRRLPLPRALKIGAADVACTTPRDCLVVGEAFDPTLPVFATHDGGRTWHVIPVPRRTARGSLVALGPGVAVLAPGSRALVTTNEGRTWRSFRLAKESIFCGVSRPSDADIWVVCGNYPSENQLTVLLTSRDGGGTWIRRTTRMPLGERLAAVSGREAWAESYEDFRAGIPSKLWHMTDGGATWRQVWISLSPQARVAQVTAR